MIRPPVPLPWGRTYCQVSVKYERQENARKATSTRWVTVKWRSAESDAKSLVKLKYFSVFRNVKMLPFNEIGPRLLLELRLFFQCPLFLRMFNSLLLHVQPFSSSHAVHVFSGLVFGVRFLAKMRVLLLCCGDPVRININNLQGKK